MQVHAAPVVELWALRLLESLIEAIVVSPSTQAGVTVRRQRQLQAHARSLARHAARRVRTRSRPLAARARRTVRREPLPGHLLCRNAWKAAPSRSPAATPTVSPLFRVAFDARPVRHRRRQDAVRIGVDPVPRHRDRDPLERHRTTVGHGARQPDRTAAKTAGGRRPQGAGRVARYLVQTQPRR